MNLKLNLNQHCFITKVTPKKKQISYFKGTFQGEFVKNIHYYPTSTTCHMYTC